MRCPVCGHMGKPLQVVYDPDHPQAFDSYDEGEFSETEYPCGHRIGRWSERVLRHDEYEYRWGEPPALSRELSRTGKGKS